VTEQGPPTAEHRPTHVSVTRLGFWAALTTAAAATAGLVLGVTTPVRSGPNCASDCVTSPYTDVAAFVPRDYLWMYPVVLMVLAFVVLVACVHHSITVSRRVFSQVASAFAVVSASFAILTYAVQLMVVQPALLNGELNGLSLWSMYNPSSVFIALENVAYLMVAVSFLFLTAALPPVGGVVRATRWVLTIAGVLAVVSLAGFAAYYGRDLGYRYEVAALSIVWITLIVTGVLLGIAFRRGAITASEQ
jgi:hypothetical protein